MITPLTVRDADTQIYCHLRQKAGTLTEDDYRNLSSSHAKRCAKQLLRHKTLAEALDPLLVGGLQYGFLLKVMHKVIQIKCPNVSNSFYLSTRFV